MTTLKTISKHRHQRGFTMVELMIALGLMIMVLGITYSSLQGIMRTSVLLEEAQEQRYIIDSILNRVSKELQLVTDEQSLLPDRENLNQPNISRLNFRGVKDSIDGNPADSISFLAISGGQFVPQGQTHAGLVQITYKMTQDPDQTFSEQPTYYLIREEVPYITPFENAYKEAIIFPITNRLKALQFQFYDSENESWVTEWGKDKYLGIPAAVKITVAIQSKSGKIERYTTSIPTHRLAENFSDEEDDY